MEQSRQPRRLGPLAAQQRDLLRIDAVAREREAEIRLHLLLPVIEADQRLADDVGQPRAHHRIGDHQPDQEARDHRVGEGQHEVARERPQDDDERHELRRLGQQPGRERRGLGDEGVHVRLDTLIRVVGMLVGEGDAVMRAVAEPALVEAMREPGAPAQLQPGIDVEVEHADCDVEHGEWDKGPDHLIPEGLSVQGLQGIVHVAVVEVEPERDRHIGEVHEDRQGDEVAADLPLGASEAAEHADLAARRVVAREIGVGDQGDVPDRLPVRDGEHDGGEDHGAGGGEVRRQQGGDHRGQRAQGRQRLRQRQQQVADPVDRDEDLEVGREGVGGEQDARHREARQGNVERRRGEPRRGQQQERDERGEHGLDAEPALQCGHAESPSRCIGPASRGPIDGGPSPNSAPLAIRRGEIVARRRSCHVKFRSCRPCRRARGSAPWGGVRHRGRPPNPEEEAGFQFASQFQSP